MTSVCHKKEETSNGRLHRSANHISTEEVPLNVDPAIPEELILAVQTSDIDIASAYYMVAMQYHSGQFSDMYKWLSYLVQNQFKPSVAVEFARLDEVSLDCREAYFRLLEQYVLRNGKEVSRE